MFTIVVQQKKPDIKLFSKGITITKLNKNGATFTLVEVKKKLTVTKKSFIDLIGSSRVILSSDFLELSDEQFNFVDEYIYSIKMMQNGVKYLLEKSTCINKHMSATLIDIHCRYQGLADILITHFNTLRIITNRKQIYQNYVDTKFYDCGATVIIEDDISQSYGTAIYISPDGIIFDKMNNSSVPIISIQNIQNINAPIIHSFRAKTPSKFLDIMPQGIDEHSYQAALYNYCGIRNLSSLYPIKATVNSIEKSIDEIALISNWVLF